MPMCHGAHCQPLLCFDHVQGVRCGPTLAYLPDLDIVSALDSADDGVWQSLLPPAAGHCLRAGDA